MAVLVNKIFSQCMIAHTAVTLFFFPYMAVMGVIHHDPRMIHRMIHFSGLAPVVRTLLDHWIMPFP